MLGEEKRPSDPPGKGAGHSGPQSKQNEGKSDSLEKKKENREAQRPALNTPISQSKEGHAAHPLQAAGLHQTLRAPGGEWGTSVRQVAVQAVGVRVPLTQGQQPVLCLRGAGRSQPPTASEASAELFSARSAAAEAKGRPLSDAASQGSEPPCCPLSAMVSPCPLSLPQAH